MGGALLSQPWRPIPKNKDENLNFVKCYQPRKEGIRLRILLHGPVGAGKSSFINSVDSVLQGRITGRALTDRATAGSSFTKHYKTYKIAKTPDEWYSFVFNDIMGLEQSADSGVHIEDVKLALMGHVKEGYQFQPGRPLAKNDLCDSSPTLNDRAHVLVSVIPAGSVTLLPDEVVKKMREVRLAASEIGIPQLAILTKVDEACPQVKKNANNIYKSKYLKTQAEEFSALLGLPLNCIFLVKNYETESTLNDAIHETILLALRQMISYGEDFLNDLESVSGY